MPVIPSCRSVFEYRIRQGGMGCALFANGAGQSSWTLEFCARPPASYWCSQVRSSPSLPVPNRPTLPANASEVSDHTTQTMVVSHTLSALAKWERQIACNTKNHWPWALTEEPTVHSSGWGGENKRQSQSSQTSNQA